MKSRDLEFRLPRSGITLRAQRTHTRDGMPTLCLHGWLDNYASFDPLFERMSDLNLIAIDLPGHGKSAPIPSTTCQYLDYIGCVVELAREAGWDRFRLIGHSLGGGLATMVAGLYPNLVDRLVLIDAIGPLSTDPDRSREGLARYLTAYLDGIPAPVYRTRAQAIRARVQLADILLDTAEQLVERDLQEVPGGYSWRSDVRLKYPSTLNFTEDQILSYIHNITAPTLLIQAERTALKEPFYPQRLESVRNLARVTLPGGHHLHMENPNPVAKTISEFLTIPSQRVPDLTTHRVRTPRTRDRI